MFKNGYSATKAIKGWAKAFYYTALTLPILSFVAFFILLCVDAEYLWWIGLIIFGGSLFLAIPLIFSAHVAWGYSEIIANTKNTAFASPESDNITDDELPAL